MCNLAPDIKAPAPPPPPPPVLEQTAPIKADPRDARVRASGTKGFRSGSMTIGSPGKPQTGLGIGK